MVNPYSPPSTASTAKAEASRASAPSTPLLPAVIGLFTYGSSSPYALVLCVEHYLDDNLKPKPISTHFATVLALLGTFGWFALNIFYLPQVLGMFTGEPLGMYGDIGVMCWIATCIFLLWAAWRFTRLYRARIAENAYETNA